MRIHIQTTANREVVPFSYQPKLVGAIHKWLGQNDYHDDLSLYSLSWLSHGRASKAGLSFDQGAEFFISSPDMDMVKSLISGIQEDPEIAYGMKATDLRLQVTPDFGESQAFFAQSPILIKRSVGKELKFYFRNDQESGELMMETLRNKLQKCGKNHLDVSIRFDPAYQSAREKAVTYKEMVYKGTLCPVIVEGDPEAVAFAWEVGIGSLTGIGFGALKE